MTSALVVGGNGFLGSHLVDRLAAEGHEVRVFDRFSGGEPRYDAVDVQAFRGLISDLPALGTAMQGVDEVYHFVSPTTPASAAVDPLADVRDGLPQSVALLQAAVDAGVGRVVFASSGGTVYGDQPVEAFSEEHLPEPISPYAVGKLAIEGYLRYFRRTYGLDTLALRIANPYGHRQLGARGQGLIAIAMQHIVDGRPLTVLGDGTMVRDYVHVDDVTATVAAMAGRPHRFDVYNIGSGTGMALSDVLAIIEGVTGGRLSRHEAPVPPSFVQRSVLDIRRVVDEFGVVPQISLERGIEEVWTRWRARVR